MVFESIWRDPNIYVNGGRQWNSFSDSLSVKDMNFIVSNLNYIKNNMGVFTEATKVVVDELPEVKNASANSIYCVPKKEYSLVGGQTVDYATIELSNSPNSYDIKLHDSYKFSKSTGKFSLGTLVDVTNITVGKTYYFATGNTLAEYYITVAPYLGKNNYWTMEANYKDYTVKEKDLAVSPDDKYSEFVVVNGEWELLGGGSGGGYSIAGSNISLEIDNSNYVMTAKLLDSDGKVISTSSVDLPLESMVVNGSYNNTTKKVVLTLQNGNTVEFSVADLVSGLVNTEELNAVRDLIPTNYVTTNTEQAISGSKSFTGTVGNIQTTPGVYLGLDQNTGAENANMAIVSANTAAYIDMGRPDVDYDFRIIKWNQPDNKYAQFVYGGNSVGTITIPQASGTMALTSDLDNYLPKNTNITIQGSGSDTPLYVKSLAGSTYIGFLNSAGTALGYFGVNSSKKPVFYDTKDNQLAFLSEVKKLGTSNWNVSQSSSGNLVFEYR